MRIFRETVCLSRVSVSVESRFLKKILFRYKTNLETKLLVWAFSLNLFNFVIKL